MLCTYNQSQDTTSEAIILPESHKTWQQLSYQSPGHKLETIILPESGQDVTTIILQESGHGIKTTILPESNRKVGNYDIHEITAIILQESMQ